MPMDHHFDPIKFHLPFMRIMNTVIVNGVQVFDNLVLQEDDAVDINVDYEDGGEDINPIMNTCIPFLFPTLSFIEAVDMIDQDLSIISHTAMKSVKKRLSFMPSRYRRRPVNMKELKKVVWDHISSNLLKKVD